ncbi:MAG: nucleotidyltransferase domain-containing protein [Deltaproteobacteria bacterium]|nr:nucleotidyltransferase domain-containing protein [Deltaproteobacteria bacterium]
MHYKKKSALCAKSRREIIAAYIFGSRASGEGNNASDVDIAL